MLLARTLAHCKSIVIAIILSQLRSAPFCAGESSLCGELEIHKQQKWMVDGPPEGAVRQLGTAEYSANLQQCLQWCCEVLDCSAISFSGFLQLSDSDNNSTIDDQQQQQQSSSSSSSSSSAANCALFQCRGDGSADCPLADATDVADQGLLSVRLRRRDTDKQQSAAAASSGVPSSASSSSTQLEHMKTSAVADAHGHEEDESESAENGDQPPPHILSLDNFGTSAEEASATTGDAPSSSARTATTTTMMMVVMTSSSSMAPAATTTTARKRAKSLLDFGTWDERFPLRAEATPVWAIGLAIVITVICLGLIVSLFCAFLCYRRHKLRMRTLEFSGPKKMPTLHAFNPS